MAETTTIEWCDHSWSPWEGCTKVSLEENGGGGCDHCYAEAMNKRFRRGENWGAGVPRRLTADWTKPVLWNRKAAKLGRRFTVFPSICDPFDNEVPPEWGMRFYELVNSTPYLTWLLLTKRIGNVKTMAPEGPFMTLPNVRIGATMVNQREWDRDIGKLLALQCPTFASLEPLLGPIDMRLGGASMPEYSPHRPLQQLGWVITGGESGPKARPPHADWFRSLRDQCAEAGVPFMFKQWGEWSGPGISFADGHPELAEEDNAARFKVGKHAAGRLLDGVEHNGFPAT